MAKELELKLKAGDVAPEFSAATSGGGKVSLADFKGQPVMHKLYLYPNGFLLPPLNFKKRKTSPVPQ